MSNYRILAAMLAAVAGWADDKIAGGTSPKWIAHQLISTTRYVAGLARYADEGGQLQDVTADLTFPDEPGPDP